MKSKDAGFGGGAGDKQMPMQVTHGNKYRERLIGTMDLMDDRTFLFAAGLRVFR